jgi:CheY-like chemotaxis protein/anti-sigma regulatory factor (Ser/Thr protein kinase)
MELDPPILYGQGFVAAINWLGRWMEQHHELQVVVSGSLPLSPMPADISSLLFRAVKELLFNVSKHSGVEKACVSITMDKHGIEVSVTDEGVGFDVANVLQTGSYGLFSIQEQLITLEGRMDINSAPGRGTTSTLTVPMAAAIGPVFDPSPETRDTATATADVHPPLPGPIRILVADDHTLARSALVQILDLIEDFDVIGQAVDGLDAVEKVRTLRPDVILMDVGMPGLDGLEATRRIAAEFPGVKVIGLSMHAKEDMQPQMLAAGAAGYLQKPIPGEELFAAIRSLMNA